MLGLSFVRIAHSFPQEVATGKLQMIVTNLEPDFTIIEDIAEAKRRIAIADHWNEIVHILTRSPGTIELLHSLNSKGKGCILPRWEDIEFLENNHHLITYIRGADTMQLPRIFATRGAIDIIHEKFGGFCHHPDRNNVLSAVAQIINPATGSIMTITPIDSILFLEGFERLIANGTSVSRPVSGRLLALRYAQITHYRQKIHGSTEGSHTSFISAPYPDP